MSELIWAFSICMTAGSAGLLAWRWWLDARADDRKAQRAHELDLHTKRVQVDQEQLDKSLALVKQLEARVKTLEYRPTKG